MNSRMKNPGSLLLIFLFPLLFISCYDETAPPEMQDDYVAKPNFLSKDTVSENAPLINYIDRKGLRQGKWIVYGRESKDSVFPANAIWREGIYVDSKEEGVWMEYYPDGMVKRKINFRRGVELK